MKSSRTIVAALALLAGTVLAACSEDAEDLSDEELRTELVRVLEEADTEPDVAQCTVDYLFDNLERDDINQLANADVIEDASQEQVDTLTDGLIECTLGS